MSKKSFLVALAVIGISLLVVVLPDSNSERVFSFNQHHGPSLVDLIGLIPLLIAWHYLLFKAVVNRDLVYLRISRMVALSLAAAFLFCSIAVFVADSTFAFVSEAAISLGCQLTWILTSVNYGRQ